MRLVANAYVSEGDPSVAFPIEEGILKAFVPHDGEGHDVTNTIREFYEENPFPDYDGTEDVGSLIERSISRGFPEMLNRSIPPHSVVLEVGCGTGQLGNFLSIADRRVLSADLCLNSLRLGQHFKVRNGLRNVTFAQMNLFRLPLAPERFDVVICTGVLHHTSNPARGFDGLLPLVKLGGYVVIGLYNRCGRLKTRLRRAGLRIFGERFAALDPYLRGQDVKGAKRTAWLMDQYRNPHESLHTIDELLGWFHRAGVQFVRALPGTIPGMKFTLEYKRSLFEESPRGSHLDRLISQLAQGVTDTEGGLFIMIGKKV